MGEKNNLSSLIELYNKIEDKDFSFDYFYLLALREGVSYMNEILVYQLDKSIGFKKGNISFRHPNFQYKAFNIMALSGGFDPPHIGHYSMFKSASEYSEKEFDTSLNIYNHTPTKVVAILNSDEWLKRKKGYSFMSFEERKFILESCRYIDYVVAVNDDDETVCSALYDIRPDIFANGGDRKQGNTPELSICEELNIKVLWNMGGEKIQSSSELVQKAKK